MDNRRPYS